MIRILSHAPVGATQTQFETDYYIPLKVRILGGTGDVPSYWRTGDFQRSLVEVGIDPRTGLLVAVTVTLVHAEQAPEVTAPPASQPSDVGVPILDLAHLRGIYTDEPGFIQLHLGSDFVWLTFTQDARHSRELRVDGLRFLIGVEDTWVGLVVEGLTTEQMEELRAGIPRE